VVVDAKRRDALGVNGALGSGLGHRVAGVSYALYRAPGPQYNKQYTLCYTVAQALVFLFLFG